MKKIFSTVAALGLVAGMATAASALDFSVTGKYTVEGYYITEVDNGEFMGTGGVMPISNAADELSSDAFFIQYFWMYPELKINDKTKIKSEVRLSDESIWGNQDDAMTTANVTDTVNVPGGGTNTVATTSGVTRDLDIHKLWMEWESPRGKVTVGRQTTGYGLPILNSYRSHADRIFWYPNFLADPWTLELMYEKSTEQDGYNATNDSDNDLYEIAFGRKAEGGKFDLAYDHIVDKRNTDTGAVNTSYDRTRERIRGWADLAYAKYFVQGEFSYDFGNWQEYDSGATTPDRDLDSLAAFIAAGGKFNNLTAYLAYVYASGQDPASNDPNKTAADRADTDMTAAIFGPAQMGLGSPFQPFYIWTGGTTGLYNDYVAPANVLLLNAGLHVFGLFGDYALTDKVSLHGAIGYALADEEDWVQHNLGLADSLDNELGWEVDLGAGYKILDNLKYEIHLGWFTPGGMFDDIASQLTTPAAPLRPATTIDTNDVYLVSNHLTLSF